METWVIVTLGFVVGVPFALYWRTLVVAGEVAFSSQEWIEEAIFEDTEELLLDARVWFTLQNGEHVFALLSYLEFKRREGDPLFTESFARLERVSEGGVKGETYRIALRRGVSGTAYVVNVV